MTNIDELKVEMLRHKDTNQSLAKALGISGVSLSRKMHSNGTQFTQAEITAIKKRYSLNAERNDEIFFSTKSSL